MSSPIRKATVSDIWFTSAVEQLQALESGEISSRELLDGYLLRIEVKRNTAGLPIGVQAMGPADDDLTTIEFAALVGAQVGGYERPAAYAG